jgi:tetratricopeptide (TPR) repeat protein
MASDASYVWKLIEKGNNAHGRSKFREAIEFCEQALAISHEVGDRRGEGAALGNLGLAYSALGMIRKAIEYHEQSLAIAREIGDRQGEGADLGNLGNVYSALGEVRKAIEYHEQALAIAREIGDRRGEGADLGNLGNVYSALGEVRKAIEFYEQVLAIFREIGDRRGEGNVLGNIGNTYYAMGWIKKAIEFYEQALAISREIGHRRGEGNVLGNIGLAYSDLGEIRKAIELYEEALTIFREIGDRGGEGAVLVSLGESNMVLGDWDKSLQLFNDALKIFETIESLTRQSEVLSYIGELQIKSGEWEDARKNLEKSLELSNRTTPVGKIDALMNIGELFSVEDRYEDAFLSFKEALRIASDSELSTKKVKICNKIVRARLMEFESNKSQESLLRAKNYCISALKLARDLQMPLDQGISLRNMGIVCFRYNQINKSKSYFRQSLEKFQTLGARYELARTYLELAKTLAETNMLQEAEEMTKVCAFDATHKEFKELKVRSYMLLGDIIWKQDSSLYGYYLTALKTAIFNPKIYTRTIFLIIYRMKRMERDTTIEFIKALREVNIEVHFDAFLSALASKIQGADYSIEDLPVELKEELDNFPMQ